MGVPGVRCQEAVGISDQAVARGRAAAGVQREPGAQASCHSLVSFCPFHDTLPGDKTAGRAGRGARRRLRDSALPRPPCSPGGRGLRGGRLPTCRAACHFANLTQWLLRWASAPPCVCVGGLLWDLSRLSGRPSLNRWTGGGRVPGSRDAQQQEEGPGDRGPWAPAALLRAFENRPITL